MKIIKYMQQGGAAPMPAEQAPAQDPLMALAEAAVAALQNQDCGLAMQVCEGFVSLLQQASGPAPVDAAPQGQPVFKKGGKLVKRNKKC